MRRHKRLRSTKLPIGATLNGIFASEVLGPFSLAETKRQFRLAYNDRRMWFEYLSIYHDLFTDYATAELKAKTHAVAAVYTLLLKYGCSPSIIFEALEGEIVRPGLALASDVLDYKEGEIHIRGENE